MDTAAEKNRGLYKTKYGNFDTSDIRIDRGISDTQGKVFERACDDGYELKTFAERYLKSHFCEKSMDYKASRYSFEDAETCLEEIYKEIGSPVLGEFVSNGDVGYWIGFTYRQLCCETGISSAEIIEKVPYDRLILNYAAHHCLDEDMSSEMLCGFFHLERLPEYVAYSEYLNDEGAANED